MVEELNFFDKVLQLVVSRWSLQVRRHTSKKNVINSYFKKTSSLKQLKCFIMTLQIVGGTRMIVSFSDR